MPVRKARKPAVTPKAKPAAKPASKPRVRKPRPKAKPAAPSQPEKTLKPDAPICRAAWAVVKQQRMMHIWRNSGRECECTSCTVVRRLRDELVKLGSKEPQEGSGA